jgi:RNase P/RNase MRP subunit POP5
MSTSTASSTKSKRSSSKSDSAGEKGGSEKEGGLSALIDSGLSSSFDAIREKISSTIGDNGEEYLHEAVEKISESTEQVVAWCKKNPIKMVIGIAALTAVSAFLVHTVGGSGAVKKVVKKAAKAAKAATSA